MYTCMILNIVMWLAFIVELCFDYEVVLDKRAAKKDRKKYIVRLVVAAVAMSITLMLLYKRFGVTGYNLGTYLRYGKI